MANDLVCEPCGKDSLNPSTMEMHLKSKAHLEMVGEVVVEEGPLESEEVKQIISVGQRDPVECARKLRKLFAQNEWPNREQPRNVRQVLQDFGVPIFDVEYRTMTEGQARKARRDALTTFKRSR